MFIVAGISSKIKEQGVISTCECPVCGQHYALRVIHKYMTPHVFFIPTFHFHSEYIAVCSSCASVMELSAEKGRALKRDPAVPVFPSDLTILQNNKKETCPRCDEVLSANQNFCPNCGERI